MNVLDICIFDKLLPRSLSNLHHLQFLRVYNYSDHPDYFPRDVNKLSNLRYLNCGVLNFPGIGKLNFLEKLRFNVMNEIGYRIEELEHMTELSNLVIANLENVRDAHDACNARLCDKRKLKHLSLGWHSSRNNVDPDLDESVLDNLQPHDYLKTLSAIWMHQAHLINNLEEIELSECLEWEILPPFGQLPFLKSLKLYYLPKVKWLGNKFHGNDMCSVFPSLERLCLRNMEALVDWFDATVVDGLFPCLTDLFLLDCPNLKELPYLPPKLKSLEIDNIGWKTYNCCSISNSSPLKELEVSQCQNITSISLAGVICKLEKQTIQDCPNLIPLEEEHH